MLAFWVPADATLNFAISNIVAIMLGITISMNIYVLIYRSSIVNKKKALIPEISVSSLLAVLSSVCISCTSYSGLLIVTIIGGVTGVGVAAATASFVSEYQIPIRLVTLGLLGCAFVSISATVNKKVNNTFQCTLTDNNNIQQVK